MDILQVNTFDRRGGAARVAADLHRRFLAEGHRSRLAAGWKQSEAGDVIDLGEFKNPWAKAWNGLERGFFSSPPGRMKGAWRSRPLFRWAARPMQLYDWMAGHEAMRFPETGKLLRSLDQQPEIIHCHNLHGDYFDLRRLADFSVEAPVVVTMHDAWLLSGHCAHSLDCDRWKTGCGECPDLGLEPAVRRDATARNWRVKRDIYTASSIYVVTPSEWLHSRLEESMLKPAIVESMVIHNGVDLDTFHPGHPSESVSLRSKLGLGEDDRMALFAANGLTGNRWKDFATLRKSLELLSAQIGERKVVCIALGEKAETERLGSIEIRFVPYLSNVGEVANYFRAADIYLHASRADTFPNSIIESLACGTPVVATRTGGIPEQIAHGETGFLVDEGDSVAMADAARRLVEDDQLRASMSASAAADASQRFDLNTQAWKYLEFFDRITAGRRHGSVA